MNLTVESVTTDNQSLRESMTDLQTDFDRIASEMREHIDNLKSQLEASKTQKIDTTEQEL